MKPGSPTPLQRVAKMVEKIGHKRATEQKVLTARQAEILEFVKLHIQKFGFAPSVAEISEAFGFASANAAHQHLQLIARKGYITTSRAARSIVVLK